MTTQDLLVEIVSGTYDDNLEAIVATIRDRQKSLSRVTFHTLQKGDKVTLKNLRPKYMVGAPATIVKKNRERIVVDVDDDFLARNPRCRFRKGVTVTADMIELVP